ncbi:SpaA isopeptide-forming pilin-related protein [Microbacterium sp. B35-04]|uniref:SpaA isopeptide-forming pilin-related protein n=1 Tax=Microbacterium sp. B35-04 TaxID=1961716 RepID=UPI0013D7B04E|nr:SpaA isopeptide-forming pilin-related protein [Microbacterium sp. B35-04]
MFSRTFVRASDEGLRRRMRQERAQERKIALQRRWYVGGLAAVVASALVFSGMSPATAEEVTPTDPAPTSEATTETPSTDAETPPPAEEPAAEEPAAEEPAPAEQPAAPEVTAPEGDAPFSALVAPLAEPEVSLFALVPCDGWPVAGSPVAGFEIDGNLCLDGDGTLDWANVGGQPVASDGFDDPEQFDQGASEANWPWSAAQTILNSGSGSAKTDIGNVYAYTQTVDGHVYAYLGFERQVNTGSVSYHVELNQADNAFGPVPTRTVGDLRLTIEQNGNNTISLVGADTWDGDSWVSLGSLAGFVGQVNQDIINRLTGTDELEAGTFAEAAIDLTKLFGETGCSGSFGVLNVRSSQSPSETSSLADWVDPIALNVPSTCATLTILKTNTDGTPLQGAEFTISPVPTGSDGTETTGADGKIVLGGIEPGVYTVTETKAPPGYLLPTSNNPQQVTLGDAETETLTFVDPLGTVTWLKHDGAGNPLGGATFQIVANTGGVAQGVAGFPRTVVDNGTNDTDPAAGVIKVVNVPIGTYTVTETAAPTGYVLDGNPQNFSITQQAPNASLTNPFVNIPFATVTLSKVWVDSFTGDKADLSIGGAATANGTSTAPTNGQVVQVSVAPGSALTLAEVLPDANTGEYSSVLTCVGATVSNNTGTGGSITVPAYPASGAGVQCTFTNTAIQKTITLQKRWVDAIEGDTAELHAGADTATSVANGTAEQLDQMNVAQVSVRVGDTVGLSEVLGGVGSYGSTYSCTSGQTTGDGTGTSFTLTVPNANVTCTFTNTADRGTVTLNKQWVNAFEGDEADLSITGAASDSATSVATGGNSTDDTNVASVEVRFGEKVTLSESLPGDNTGEYTATWFCSDGSSGEGDSIPEITVEGDLDCTIVNTADEISVTLDKRWIDAFEGDVASMSINGTTEESTANGTANQLDEDVVTVSVRVGDDVNIHEVLDSATNTGEYDSSYACSTVANGVGQGRDFDFVAPDSDVSCTFINTAIKVGVVLHKQWIGAVLGDDTTLSVTPEAGPILTRLSEVIGTGTFIDNINTVVLQARIGAVLPMNETIALNALGQYDSTYSCTGGQASGTGVGRSFQLTVTGPSLCFFVNQARTAKVHLVKTWVNGQEGDSADLSISGLPLTEDTSVSNGDVGSWTDVQNALEKQALIGSEVTVSEVLDVVEGEASDYTSSLVCITVDHSKMLEVDARSGTFTMPNESVWCEFTNTAERPTLSLVKVVNGAQVADTNWQLFGTPAEGDAVTNPAGGDVAPTAVLPGVEFDLSEDVIGDVPGLGEFEPELWSCVSDDAGTITLTDSEPGAATLRGLDKGENVVCTIVNTHVDQGYTLDKTAISSVQNEDDSWTVTYEITVHNNSVLVPITYDLTDTLDTPAAGVTYTGASWSGPTSGDFDLESSLTAVLADDEELAAYNGSNDAVYTVVVEVDVTAEPADPTTCEEGGEGIGIVNTAELTVGEDEPIDDEACGTVHFDDVDIVKTSNLPEGQTSVEPGDEFDYVLTVTNNGTRDATDVVVTDPIPDRLEVTGLELPDGWANDNAPDLVDGDNVLQVSTPLLLEGDSVEITVTVEFLPAPVPPIEPGDGTEEPPAPLEELVNEACVAAERDEVDENNCSEIEIPVREITAIVYTRCVADAPLLGWTITKSAALIDEEIDFLWTPDNGTATTDPANVSITQPGGTATWSEEIDWPGAAFTPSGVSIDYPGWRPIVASDIVPGSTPTQYYYPGTTDIISAADQPDYVFNGLILDDSELDYAWRLSSTITFTVNPELVFTTEYPAATPECSVARHSNVQIEKTASVEKTDPGASFTYTLAVANVSDDAAAESVVVTDAIPADIKITDVSWVGEGDDAVFPNWQTCEVTGQNSAGYGGTLECVLFGPLQPQGANEGASAAPTITLAATVNPASTSSSITNVAVVDYHTFGDPDDAGRDSDDAIVLLSALPATGGELPPLLVIMGLFALLGGTTLLLVARRRRGEVKANL